MKIPTKTLIFAVLAFLITVCSGCREETPADFHNKELVENAYACWEIKKEMGEETICVLFPVLPFEDLSFPGYRFYPEVKKGECSGEMKLEISCKKEGEELAEIKYLLPKRGQDNISVDYIYSSCMCKYSEEYYIRSNSGYLLTDSLNPLRLRLALHKEREERGFELFSAAFGSRLSQVEELIGNCMKNIRVERGEYAFTIPSPVLGDITCCFDYNPDPVLAIKQISFGNSPLAEKDFSVGYVNPKNTDDFWGYIKGSATAETKPLEILSSALDLVKKHLEERLPSLKEGRRQWLKEYEELTAELEAARKANIEKQRNIVMTALGTAK